MDAPNDPFRTYRYTEILDTRAIRKPIPITDIKILSSDLCNGEIEAEVLYDSRTHGDYNWTYNNTLTQSSSTPSTSFNLNAPITGNFNLEVTTSNLCASTSYSKNFVINTPFLISASNIDVPTNYYRGRNYFSIDPNISTSNVEYRWTFTVDAPNNLDPSIMTQQAQGYNLTNFSPDFGTASFLIGGLVTDYTLTLEMRIGCGNWFAAKSITDDNITYIPRYYGGGSGSSSNRLNPSGLSNEAVSKEDKTAVQKSAFSTLNEGDNTLTAYPNPTTDFVELSYTGEVIKSVQVYDVTGSLVSQQLNETTIDLSHLPKGMYMVKVQTATTSKTVQVAKQ